MILTAYFDESGTHAGSPAIVMAGIMGSARQWDSFQSALAGLRSDYGFKAFHSKRFKARKDEFAGWDDEKRLSLVRELTKAMETHLMQGVVARLHDDQYRTDYLNAPDLKRSDRLDTAYGLAFRASLNILVAEATRRLGHHKKFDASALHVVLERGHQHAGDAERIFVEMQKSYALDGLNILKTFSLATKRTADLLLVADFIAHTYYMMALREEPIKVSPEGPRSRRRGGLVYLSARAGGLAELRAFCLERQRLIRRQSRIHKDTAAH